MLSLRETPHIRIRKANGLYNIDYTAADIIPGNSINSNHHAAARSYNTIIGVYTEDSTGQKIYLNTAGVYSTTTATKHKPRAAAIASYNNYKIIDNIKPEILHDLFFYNKYNVDDILKEYQERREILKELQDGNHSTGKILDAKYKSIITAARKPADPITYKNGNSKQIYYYKTNFKYFSNIYYKVTVRTTKTRHKGYYGRTGYKPEFYSTEYKHKVTITDY